MYLTLDFKFFRNIRVEIISNNQTNIMGKNQKQENSQKITIPSKSNIENNYLTNFS